MLGHIASSSNNVAKHYLFDIEMFSHIAITSSQSFTNGETITGGTSGATATAESVSGNVNPTAITQSTAANPVVITMAVDLEIKDGSLLQLQVLQHKHN